MTKTKTSKKCTNPALIKRAEELREVSTFDSGGRFFFVPDNSEDTEPDLPPLELLAQGYNLIKPRRGYRYKTKEEILEDGTIYEKMRLLVADMDLGEYLDEKEDRLTEGEIDKLYSVLLSREKETLSRNLYKEFAILKEHGDKQQHFHRRFQTSFAILAVLLNRLEEYTHTQAQLNLFYDLLGTETSITEAGEKEAAKWVSTIPEETRREIIDTLINSNILHGAKLTFNEYKSRVLLDVSGRRGLTAQIQEAAASVNQTISHFKAFAVAAEEFIQQSKLYYIPTSVLLSIETMKEERFTRYLVKDLRYFRSDLNERIRNGDTITKEREESAIIPDLCESPFSTVMYKGCKDFFKHYAI